MERILLDQRTHLVWILQGSGDNSRAPAQVLPGTNNPDMASHHIAAGVRGPNCERDNVIKLKKVIFQA